MYSSIFAGSMQNRLARLVKKLCLFARLPPAGTVKLEMHFIMWLRAISSECFTSTQRVKEQKVPVRIGNLLSAQLMNTVTEFIGKDEIRSIYRG